jgi:hypothetical protein
MFSKINRQTAIAASLALLLAPVAAIYPQELKDTDLRECVANTIYGDVQDMGTFWAQRLYRDLFPEANHGNLDCKGTQSNCFINVECSE